MLSPVRHFKAQRFCGICAQAIDSGADITILFGDETGTHYRGCSKTCSLPDPGPSLPQENGMYPCQNPYCGRCRRAAETSTVHQICFIMFIRSYRGSQISPDYLDFLWTAAIWRRPWKRAPFAVNENHRAVPAWSPSRSFCKALYALPLELRQMIYELSTNCDYWRCIIVSQLAARFGTMQRLASSIPLWQLDGWKRWQSPRVTDKVQLPSLARITFDVAGVKEVEFLSDMPAYGYTQDDYHMFQIVRRDKQQRDAIIAHFAFGMMRLGFRMLYPPRVWDTPNPPTGCNFCVLQPARDTTLRTISLKYTTGLTFFFIHGMPFLVHVHTQDGRVHGAKFEHLTPRKKLMATRIYLPLPPADSLLGITLQRDESMSSDGSLCFLLRMKLAGELLVGFWYNRYKQSVKNYRLCGPAEALVYDQLLNEPITTFGAVPPDDAGSEPCVEVDPQHTSAEPFGEPMLRSAYYSTLPLTGVKSIKLYYSDQYQTGVLVEYQNGAQRTAGQCRVGVDSYEVYQDPVSLCLRRVTKAGGTRRGLRLEVAFDSHTHSEDDWHCSAMEGDLIIWFDYEQTDGYIHK